MNYTKHTADLLAHYKRLVLEAGFQEYTLARVDYMASKQPAMYGEFPAAVREVVERSRVTLPGASPNPKRP